MFRMVTGPDNGDIDRHAGNLAVLGPEANNSPRYSTALADDRHLSLDNV